MLTDKKIGIIMLSLGIGLLCVTFYLGLAAFVNPDTLARFEALMPGTVFVYLIPVALLWVMGSIAGRIMTHGLSMLRSRQSERI